MNAMSKVRLQDMCQLGCLQDNFAFKMERHPPIEDPTCLCSTMFRTPAWASVCTVVDVRRACMAPGVDYLLEKRADIIAPEVIVPLFRQRHSGFSPSSGGIFEVQPCIFSSRDCWKDMSVIFLHPSSVFLKHCRSGFFSSLRWSSLF